MMSASVRDDFIEKFRNTNNAWAKDQDGYTELVKRSNNLFDDRISKTFKTQDLKTDDNTWVVRLVEKSTNLILLPLDQAFQAIQRYHLNVGDSQHQHRSKTATYYALKEKYCYISLPMIQFVLERCPCAKLKQNKTSEQTSSEPAPPKAQKIMAREQQRNEKPAEMVSSSAVRTALVDRFIPMRTRLRKQNSPAPMSPLISAGPTTNNGNQSSSFVPASTLMDTSTSNNITNNSTLFDPRLHNFATSTPLVREPPQKIGGCTAVDSGTGSRLSGKVVPIANSLPKPSSANDANEPATASQPPPPQQQQPPDEPTTLIQLVQPKQEPDDDPPNDTFEWAAVKSYVAADLQQLRNDTVAQSVLENLAREQFAGWKFVESTSGGEYYFYSAKTGISTFELPDEWDTEMKHRVAARIPVPATPPRRGSVNDDIREIIVQNQAGESSVALVDSSESSETEEEQFVCKKTLPALPGQNIPNVGDENLNYSRVFEDFEAELAAENLHFPVGGEQRDGENVPRAEVQAHKDDEAVNTAAEPVNDTSGNDAFDFDDTFNQTKASEAKQTALLDKQSGPPLKKQAKQTAKKSVMTPAEVRKMMTEDHGAIPSQKVPRAEVQAHREDEVVNPAAHPVNDTSGNDAFDFDDTFNQMKASEAKERKRAPAAKKKAFTSTSAAAVLDKQSGSPLKKNERAKKHEMTPAKVRKTMSEKQKEQPQKTDEKVQRYERPPPIFRAPYFRKPAVMLPAKLPAVITIASFNALEERVKMSWEKRKEKRGKSRSRSKSRGGSYKGTTSNYSARGNSERRIQRKSAVKQEIKKETFELDTAARRKRCSTPPKRISDTLFMCLECFTNFQDENDYFHHLVGRHNVICSAIQVSQLEASYFRGRICSSPELSFEFVCYECEGGGKKSYASDEFWQHREEKHDEVIGDIHDVLSKRLRGEKVASDWKRRSFRRVKKEESQSEDENWKDSRNEMSWARKYEGGNKQMTRNRKSAPLPPKRAKFEIEDDDDVEVPVSAGMEQESQEDIEIDVVGIDKEEEETMQWDGPQSSASLHKTVNPGGPMQTRGMNSAPIVKQTVVVVVDENTQSTSSCAASVDQLGKAGAEKHTNRSRKT